MIAMFRHKELKVLSYYIIKDDRLREEVDQGKDSEFSFMCVKFETFNRYPSGDVEL